MYRIFDITLHSDFPLPELAVSEDEDCSLSVRLGERNQLDERDFETVFEWPGQGVFIGEPLAAPFRK